MRKGRKRRNVIGNDIFSHIPEILTLIIKRYSDSKSKNSAPIAYTEDLDLGILGVKRKKQLCSFIIHRGKSLKSGHFITFVKNEAESTWTSYDDDDVTTVTWDQVKNYQEEIYILFFR
jgi:ubiquitin C-terminal hydrolase